jgi:hypothetical protein
MIDQFGRRFVHCHREENRQDRKQDGPVEGDFDVVVPSMKYGLAQSSMHIRVASGIGPSSAESSPEGKKRSPIVAKNKPIKAAAKTANENTHRDACFHPCNIT